jgi:hypothetical protein
MNMTPKTMREKLVDKILDPTTVLPIQRKENGWWLMAIPCEINGHMHEISCMSRYKTKFGNYGYRFVLDRYTEEIDMALSFTIGNDGGIFSYNDFSATFSNILLKIRAVVDVLETEFEGTEEIDLVHPVTVKL